MQTRFENSIPYRKLSLHDATQRRISIFLIFVLRCVPGRCALEACAGSMDVSTVAEVAGCRLDTSNETFIFNICRENIFFVIFDVEFGFKVRF